MMTIVLKSANSNNLACFFSYAFLLNIKEKLVSQVYARDLFYFFKRDRVVPNFLFPISRSIQIYIYIYPPSLLSLI